MNSCNLFLIRDTFSDKSIIGKLYLNGEFIAHTLELPWKNNQKGISCVPKGVYNCRVRYAEESASRDYTHLIVEDVPDRTYILFHRGNSAKDSRGCILTGMMRGDDVIYQSTNAHNLLIKTILDNKMENIIELVIKNR